MTSLSFPKMFNSTYTLTSTDVDATLTNIRLLLHSCKETLLGDPYFGSNLRKFIYEQNNVLLQDIIIDEIYVCLTTFIPQIYVKRNDIKLTSSRESITAVINCINKLDNTPNMYDIRLTD